MSLGEDESMKKKRASPRPSPKERETNLEIVMKKMGTNVDYDCKKASPRPSPKEREANLEIVMKKMGTSVGVPSPSERARVRLFF